MGQGESGPAHGERVPIYADDGVTVIGSAENVKTQSPLYPEITDQRWYDSPGPAAPINKRLPEQVFKCKGQRSALDPGPQMPFLPPEDMYHQLPSPQATELELEPVVPSAIASQQALRGLNLGNGEVNDDTACMGVRNRTSQALVVSCGGSSMTVQANSLGTVHVCRSSVQVWASDGGCGSLVCELDGLPLDGSNIGPKWFRRAVIVLQEVGGVVCAALDYSRAPEGGEIFPEPDSEPAAASPSPNAPAPPTDKQPDTGKSHWEMRLQDALARGDEEGAREALGHL